MNERIYTKNWLDVPKDIREHLKKVFNIQRSGITEVRDNMIVSDGTTDDDLSVINKESMERYVGSSGEFYHLWKTTISKAKYELYPPQILKSLDEEDTDEQSEEQGDKEIIQESK